ncbi:MAG: nicotinate-nucleotide adenylyltransferase [Candidatus Brocadiia bacterium]
MKIAVLGGTFNPIHNGHMAIARAVAKRLNPDKILFVPCYLPYHKLASNPAYRGKCTKNNDILLPAKHRLTMVKLAIKRCPKFIASSIDLKVKRPTYSINTIRKLRKLYPLNTKFYFIIGTDSLLELHKWYRINDLINLVDFVVIARPGYSLGKMTRSMRFPIPVIRKITASYISRPALDISSTDIRRKIAAGRSIEKLVPEQVKSYITNHKLYLDCYL